LAVLALATLSTLLAAAVSFTRPLYLDLSCFQRRWSFAHVDGGCATLCYVNDGMPPVLKASVRSAGLQALRPHIAKLAKEIAESHGLVADLDQRLLLLSQGGREQDLTARQRLTDLSTYLMLARTLYEEQVKQFVLLRDRYFAPNILNVAASNSVFGFFISMSIKPAPEVVVRFPLWLPVILFAFLPIRAFIRGPIARRRLRRRRDLGQCIGCGYDLTGNVSGVCPECGAAIPKPDAPPGPSA
jgi:hypothetical protein